MKKMRLHIYIAMAFFLTFFIVGSFLDLEISKMAFIKDHGFGIAVSALSMNLGYGVIALMGGIVFHHALKFRDIAWQKILIIVFALAFYGCATYFAGEEFFGENGWYGVAPEWVGYLIAAPLMAGCSVSGYFIAKKVNNPSLFFLMVVGALFIVLALIIGTVLIKNFFHRPRYRIVVYEGYADFYPWWERCVDYKSIMAQFGLLKEEFRSFPSGHTSVCSLVMLFVVVLPFILNKEIKHQVLYFYLALLYALFVANTRIVVGAHFMSDVGMGGLITTTCLYIYYEIILHYPSLYKEKEVTQE